MVELFTIRVVQYPTWLPEAQVFHHPTKLGATKSGCTPIEAIKNAVEAIYKQIKYMESNKEALA